MQIEGLKIDITTATNPENWGSEATAQEGRIAAEVLVNMLGEYAQEQYPDADIRTQTTRRVNGTTYKLVHAYFANDISMEAFEKRQEIEQDIAEYAEEIWERAAEKAIEEGSA